MFEFTLNGVSSVSSTDPAAVLIVNSKHADLKVNWESSVITVKKK